jgi:hypothetical protein
MIHEYTEHLGYGIYATWNGCAIELRVNDHRAEPVVHLEPSQVAELVKFLQRKQEAP